MENNILNAIAHFDRKFTDYKIFADKVMHEQNEKIKSLENYIMNNFERRLSESANALKSKRIEKSNVSIDDVSPITHSMRLQLKRSKDVKLHSTFNLSVDKYARIDLDNPLQVGKTYYYKVNCVCETITQIIITDATSFNHVVPKNTDKHEFTLFRNNMTADLASVQVHLQAMGGANHSGVLTLEIYQGDSVFESVENVTDVQILKYGETEFDNPEVLTPNRDGIIPETDSLYPITSFKCSDEQYYVEVTYNKNINSVLK